jgi:phage replication-related protein YjqB (UPF0714/DUF867 family)
MGGKTKRTIAIRRNKQGEVKRIETTVDTPQETPSKKRMKVKPKEHEHKPVVHVGAHIRGTGTVVNDYWYDNIHSEQAKLDKQKDWHDWQGWRGTKGGRVLQDRVTHHPRRTELGPPDKYKSYTHLSSKEREGVDYSIEHHRRNDNAAILAVHGGNTEPGTTEAAKAIAGNDYNYYSMVSHKPLDNNDLHITSNSFDEPRAVKLVQNSISVISLHGAKDQESAVYMGGHDEDRKKRIQKSLEEHGFDVKVHENPGLSGRGATNIANRGLTKGGVQLELSRGLREEFFSDGLASRKEPTQRFHDFVTAVRTELKSHPSYLPKHIEHPKRK